MTHRNDDATATAAVTVTVADADRTREIGWRLAAMLAAGDLVLLSGELGAGKTTLVQGIGAGMHVRGQVASPTFIIARVHPALGDGPDLVHVDAYRLTSLEEVDALDLDTSLEESVTVVEWGTGRMETLADERLEIDIRRPHGTDGGGEDLDDLAAPAPRELTVRGLGNRWAGVDLTELLGT